MHGGRSARRWSVSILLALAAAVTAGCGGGDAGARPAAQDPKEAYVARADAICKQANETELRVAPGDPGDGLTDRVSDAEEFVGAGRKALTELRRLEPPPGDEEKVARIVDAFERMQEIKDSELRAVRAGKRPAEEVEGDWLVAYSDFAAAAGTYGIVECQGVGTN